MLKYTNEIRDQNDKSIITKNLLKYVAMRTVIKKVNPKSNYIFSISKLNLWHIRLQYLSFGHTTRFMKNNLTRINGIKVVT